MATNFDIGELLASTLPAMSAEISDNISQKSNLYARLKQKGRVGTWNGGYAVRENLEYTLNDTFMWYDGYEFLDVSPTDPFTVANFPIRQASIAVTIDGFSQRANRGSAEVFDLVNAKVQNAKKSAAQKFSTALFSDGTGAQKSIQGLGALVSKTPDVGIVGGIDAAQHEWWRNTAVDATTGEFGAVTVDNIQDYMNEIVVNISNNGSDAPDLIIMGKDYYLKYQASLTDQLRFTSNDTAGTGFKSLKFYGPGGEADVVLDTQAGDKTAYFLNTDYLAIKEDPERKWTPTKERQPVNQDATTRLLLWMGAFTVSNRARQAVLFES